MLQYLTSRQALADLAGAHRHVYQEYNLTTANKFVAFGGSYPGLLAAFLRASYPDLFSSAVASSAPVKAKLDMAVFNDIGAKAYSVAYVGGSTNCQDAIATGHATARSLLGSVLGRTHLAELFPSMNGLLVAGVDAATWLLDRVNQRAFMGCGVASFPAQANDPSCTAPACNIRSICEVMVDEDVGAPLDRLAKVAHLQGPTADGAQGCEMDWTFTEFSPSNTPNASGLQGAGRYWGYQTCNEFGFYQTCEVGSGCFYAQGFTGFTGAAGEHRPDTFCKSNFGLDEQATKAAIAESQRHYGALIANASRIMWVNGQVDPWYGLSHLESPGKEQPVLFVKGASHHQWTHPSTAADLPSIVAARAAIRKQVSIWLDLP